MWHDLATNADSSVVYVLRAPGDASGYGSPNIHRFDEQRASGTWSESIVLRDGDLTQWFPRGTHLMRIDRVSTDGRYFLIGINKPFRKRGHTTFLNWEHLRFDTQAREFSSPFENPAGNPDVDHPRPLAITSAEFDGGGLFLGKELRLECADGRVLERPAGQGMVWADLRTSGDSTVAYAVLSSGDKAGYNAKEVYRFQANQDSEGWVESVVLGRSELTPTFSETARLTSLDSVSPDGETLLVFVEYRDPRLERRSMRTGEGTYSIDLGFRRHSFLFDTETREFSSPLDD